MVTIWAIAVWAQFLLDAEQKEAAELAQRQLPLADLLAAVLLGLVTIARRRRRRFCCPPAQTIISWVRVHIVTSSSRLRAASRPLPVAVSHLQSLSPALKRTSCGPAPAGLAQTHPVAADSLCHRDVGVDLNRTMRTLRQAEAQSRAGHMILAIYRDSEMVLSFSTKPVHSNREYYRHQARVQ